MCFRIESARGAVPTRRVQRRATAGLSAPNGISPSSSFPNKVSGISNSGTAHLQESHPRRGLVSHRNHPACKQLHFPRCVHHFRREVAFAHKILDHTHDELLNVPSVHCPAKTEHSVRTMLVSHLSDEVVRECGATG